MRDVTQWVYDLSCSSLKGLSTSALSVFGAIGVSATGLLEMPKMTLTQVVIVVAAGALVGAFTFLQNKPLPPRN